MGSCRDQFKIRPIHKLYKELGVKTEWIGFSANEQGRALKKRRFKNPWEITFPLIEQGVTTADCEWVITHYPLPMPQRSSCIFCPYQHPSRVRLLYERHPDLFEKVGLLEDRALSRKSGWYLYHDKPWRTWGVTQLHLLGDDWNYGCQDGYCFR